MKTIKRAAFAAETIIAIALGVLCVKAANAADMLGMRVDVWVDAAQARLERAGGKFSQETPPRPAD